MLQCLERTVTGAKVIDRDLATHFFDGINKHDRLIDVVDRCCFRDLNNQSLRQLLVATDAIVELQ